MKTAPALVREAINSLVLVEADRDGLDTYEMLPCISKTVMVEIEGNIENVIRLVMGQYYHGDYSRIH
jgi:hypothetical protein